MIQKIFSHNVKLRRERIGMTQKELAEKSELSLSAIARIEQGSRWPSSENVDRIAKALGIPVTALFSGLPPKITPIEALHTLIEHFQK